MDTTTFTPIICSECGTGNYRRSVLTGKVACDHCAHAIYEGDIDLEAGETMAWSDRVLGYTTDDAPHVGHYSRLGGAWWCDTCDSPYCDLA